MSFGFKVINDFGTVLIDDTYANLAFVSKTDYSTTSDPSGFYSRLVFTFTGQYPVFAFRCTAAYATVVAVQQSGSTYTVTMRCNGPVGTAIRIYVFDRPTVASTGYGIRVRDGAGNITFDSGYKYMKVAGAFSTEFANPPVNWPIIAGPEYAVIQGGYLYAQYWISVDPPTDPNARGSINTEISGLKIDSSVLSATIYEDSQIPSQPFYDGGYGGRCDAILIDVTNL